INNVDDRPSIYINQTDGASNYLRVRLKYTTPNTLGIGTRIYSFHRGIMQVKELYTARGFQASSEPLIHFGYGESSVVDSIKIVWPDGRIQKEYQIQTNQTIVISPDHTVIGTSLSTDNTDLFFNWIQQEEIGLTFEHREDAYSDFDR